MDVKNNKVDANGKKRKYIYESRYQQIAVELAQKIADGWYTIGEKISARSTLASNYNVSPETARKAVNILVDLGIVTIRQGSGTYVASREKAHLFVERYQNTVSMQEIRREISDCVNRQQEELDHLSKLLKTLVGQTKRSHSTASFVPYDIRSHHRGDQKKHGLRDFPGTVRTNSGERRDSFCGKRTVQTADEQPLRRA